MNNYDYDEEADDYDYDECDDTHSPYDDWELGCCFPDRCLMPGDHFRAECYDVSMAEATD
jgi:hypothetical protein